MVLPVLAVLVAPVLAVLEVLVPLRRPVLTALLTLPLVLASLRDAVLAARLPRARGLGARHLPVADLARAAGERRALPGTGLARAGLPGSKLGAALTRSALRRARLGGPLRRARLGAPHRAQAARGRALPRDLRPARRALGAAAATPTAARRRHLAPAPAAAAAATSAPAAATRHRVRRAEQQDHAGRHEP
jgi:hypothetical protein